ncbi:unnamed protein product [Dovyalis caffra]|uniref:Secreted protein n=1 Tax=Dovyalis caffra TaxID=77055 RepID=A0AAV1RQZ1_9ROSI|nr:unnamed protein product [Dovyalis caffra]
MKTLKIFLLVAMLMAFAYTLSATTKEESFLETMESQGDGSSHHKQSKNDGEIKSWEQQYIWEDFLENVEVVAEGSTDKKDGGPLV